MEIYIGLLVSFCLLLYSVLESVFIGYILIACWIIFALISWKRGYKLKAIAKMSFNKTKQSFVVLKMFVLIGAVIGTWMASGTIPAIVYYCLKYIMPYPFVLSTFLICCIMSFLIGTSLGTVSTVGIPLMIIARSGNINLDITAGAIMAGAYFGDRCSPMSSSAALVSNLTQTNIFINIKNMIYSSIAPFLLSIAFYYLLSISHPLKVINNNLSGEILRTFNIGYVMLLPAIFILVLSLCKVKIHLSILFSILSASVLAVFFQHHQLIQVIQYVVFGFKLNNPSPLQAIIQGGGIVSMLKASLVIVVSFSLAGIFEGIQMFDNSKKLLLNLRLTRSSLFGVTTIVSSITAAFGCNQSIAVVMTKEIMKDSYESNNSNNYLFALDLENSGILISALIPWNIAALVPTTALNVSTTGYLPFAFYLYITPIVYFLLVRKYNFQLYNFLQHKNN